MSDQMRQLFPTDYPVGLRHIPEVPESLYVRGTLPSEGTKYLVVVGSRELSDYGRRACTTLIQGLKDLPITIVSGLALGTDACAHEAALSAGLHTIAVPGSAITDSEIAPRTNFPLAKRILASGGALISEYPPGYRVHKGSFPRRNRIMVGMADAVLVIEAGERSGTLVTARLTHEYNRELLCVPHRIDDAHGVAAHTFIPLGAGVVATSKDISDALRI